MLFSFVINEAFSLTSKFSSTDGHLFDTNTPKTVVEFSKRVHSTESIDYIHYTNGILFISSKINCWTCWNILFIIDRNRLFDYLFNTILGNAEHFAIDREIWEIYWKTYVLLQLAINFALYFVEQPSTGSQNASSEVMYLAINEKIEQKSQLFHFVLTKLSLFGLLLPSLWTTTINYFVHGLNGETFYWSSPMIYVLPFTKYIL